MRFLCAIAALLVTMGCGEFSTRCLYEQCGDVVEVQVEVRRPHEPEQVDPCPKLVPVEIHTTELPEAHLNAPYAFALDSSPSHDIDWWTPPSGLPPGISLDPRLGILVGVPEAEGLYIFTVEANPQQDALLCFEKAEREYSLAVTVACIDNADCNHLLEFLPEPVPGQPPERSPICQDGVCVMSGGDCPGSATETAVVWKEPEGLDGVGGAGWIIVEHKKLSSSDPQGKAPLPAHPFNHALTMEKDRESITFEYSLPDSWPLPYCPGQVAGFKVGGNQTGLPADSVLFWVDDWRLPGLFFNGTMETSLLDQMHVPGFQDFSVTRWPLNCPSEPHQACGYVRPDGLSLSNGGESTFSFAGQLEEARLEKHNVLLGVGSAFSHSSYAADMCAGTMPSWASFFLYPLDAGPLAVITSNATPAGSGGRVLQQGCSLKQGPAGDYVSCFIGDAFLTEPPEAIFSAHESLSPSGVAVEGWTWRLEQPTEGFVKLEDQSENGIYQSLQPSLCGNYKVLLQVEDEYGAPSCVDDLMEVRVVSLPGLDLRVELMWRSGDRWEEQDDTATLLLFHPLAANKPWDSPGWVCMYDLEEQLSKDWSMANQQGPPGDCHLRRGDMGKGHPEVITVDDLMPSTSHKNFPPYKLAVRAPHSNTEAVSVSLRLFFDEDSPEPVHEVIDKQMPPGTVWSPGVINTQNNDTKFIKNYDWL